MVRLSSVSRFLPASIRTASIWCREPNREKFVCPICDYYGPFLAYGTDKVRKHACCPCCESLERHRLIWLVLGALGKENKLSGMRALHFAPERCLRKRLARMFRRYETADISGKHVDHKVDICNLPFPDASFDIVIVSHVLHYIRDEIQAMRSIKRVLSPGGLAILPVPVFSDMTVEYPEPIGGQVRSAGRDYFDRCRSVFGSVRLYSSADFDVRHQVWIHEDRSHWPPHLGLRPCSSGEKHDECIPVCVRQP